MSDAGQPCCPHCQSELLPMRLPDNTGWLEATQLVCFNDDCSYYRDGWEWMWTQYRVKSSYRYRILGTEPGHASPLPVWSDTAMRDRIVPKEQA